MSSFAPHPKAKRASVYGFLVVSMGRVQESVRVTMFCMVQKYQAKLQSDCRTVQIQTPIHRPRIYVDDEEEEGDEDEGSERLMC